MDYLTWKPPEDPAADQGDGPAAALVRLAILNYGHWHPRHAARARALLAADPALAKADLATAATVGDVEEVGARLAADPASATARCGPYGWAPLLYACYSRLDSDLPGHDTLEVARLLLAAGASPNAGFLWDGNTQPFTALTAAFGEGENGRNQPPHRRRDELARLLLDAGADPDDEQTLYNRHFLPDDGHLRLLFEYGLAEPRLLSEELWQAAKKNFRARVELLIEHGVDVTTPGRRDGRTPYEVALLAGNREVADLLVAHGAPAVALSPTDTFAAACVAGRRDEAIALRDARPGLLDELGRHGRIALVHRAVEADRPEGVRLLAELGFELSSGTEHDGAGLNLGVSPLHNAAWMGNLPMVQLLLELGADPEALDPTYGATPQGWAEHNQQAEVAAYLGSRGLRIVHEGRGGFIELEGARYPIEHVEGGRFSIHVPHDQDPRRARHRSALERLVASEPETWSIEDRPRGAPTRPR